jgi:hypothetical protein
MIVLTALRTPDFCAPGPLGANFVAETPFFRFKASGVTTWQAAGLGVAALGLAYLAFKH